MPQQRSNKSQTPINADAFNLTPDLATLSDSLEVIVPVADDAEGNTVATARAAAGWPVTDARPLFVYNTTTKTARLKDSTGWRNLVDSTARPFAHVGLAAGFQTVAGAPGKVMFDAAQHTRGGLTFSDGNDNVVVALAGWYRITAQCYTSGTGSGTQIFIFYINAAQTGFSVRMNKQGGNDTVGSITGMYQFAANDTISLWAQMTTDVQTWGTSGYNGTWFQVEYVMP